MSQEVSGLQDASASWWTGLWDWSLDSISSLRDWALEYFEENRSELFYASLGLLYAIVRAAGRTVQTGSTGLKFSFGRARRVLEPGFYPLIPFFQRILSVPTRSRTLDLPAQRVATHDSLVYDVDASLVYRVADVRRALIEIDDLRKGMLQMLGLAVQELLRDRQRSELYPSPDLDGALGASMAPRLEPWGVSVERAGFTSIRPSERTLRLTQLQGLGRARRQAQELLEGSGLAHRQALALLGPMSRILSRTRALRAIEEAHRSQRRVRRRVELERARQGAEANRLKKKKKKPAAGEGKTAA